MSKLVSKKKTVSDLNVFLKTNSSWQIFSKATYSPSLSSSICTHILFTNGCSLQRFTNLDFQAKKQELSSEKSNASSPTVSTSAPSLPVVSAESPSEQPEPEEDELELKEKKLLDDLMNVTKEDEQRKVSMLYFNNLPCLIVIFE